MSKRILIIEDDVGTFQDIERAISGLELSTFPEKLKGEISDLSSKTGLIHTLNIANDEAFASVHKEYADIDLYIVDISLNVEDNNGIKFLNYLKRIGQLESNYIIVSGLDYSTVLEKSENLDFGKNDFVSKSTNYLNKIRARVVEKVSAGQEKNEQFNQKSKENNNSFADWSKKIKLGLHWAISTILYISILASLIYGGIGVIYKDMGHGVYHAFCQEKNDVPTEAGSFISDSLSADTVFPIVHEAKSSDRTDEGETLSARKENEIDKLVLIEHIFLYLLPLFVLLGFNEYYQSTVGVILKEGNPTDYKPKYALRSLDNSKLLLLSSLLSFSLIKVIEKIFITEVTEIVSLVSYFLIIVVLMVYIVLNHYVHKD